MLIRIESAREGGLFDHWVSVSLEKANQFIRKEGRTNTRFIMGMDKLRGVVMLGSLVLGLAGASEVMSWFAAKKSPCPSHVIKTWSQRAMVVVARLRPYIRSIGHFSQQLSSKLKRRKRRIGHQ